jgi:thiol:disulfide interchange protein DsbD
MNSMGPRLLFAALMLAPLVVSCGKTDIAPNVEWNDLATGERKARRTGKPAVVFLHAEWSVADKEMEHKSFTAPEVRAAMRDFIAISVDVTDDENPETRAAADRFGVIGVPTVIVIDDLDAYPSQNESHPRYANPKDLIRWNEYVAADRLAHGLRAAKSLHDARARRD